MNPHNDLPLAIALSLLGVLCAQTGSGDVGVFLFCQVKCAA